jgi:hypothetical protein
MNTKMKNELISDVLTGLMVAATFAAVIPVDALAQTTGTGTNLASAVTSGTSAVVGPFLRIVTYISYGLGAVLTVAGIAGAKKHSDAPGQNPLGPVLGRLGAGAAFLAAPALVGVIQGTGTGTFGSSGAAFTTSIMN